MENCKIITKWTAQVDPPAECIDSNSTTTCTVTDGDTWKEVCGLIPDVMDILSEIGRADDFVTIIKAIKTGEFAQNITMHLLLDVMLYIRQTTQGSKYNIQWYHNEIIASC